MKTVAVVGTNGIPARYGGYETLAEHLTAQLIDRFRFIVYCAAGQPRVASPAGLELVYSRLKANGWQSFLYDAVCLVSAFLRADIVLYLGPGNGFALLLNLLARKRLIVNHGGVDEWKREKFGAVASALAYFGHGLAAKLSDVNVVDNEVLRDSLKRNFGAESVVIRYGGDHVSPEEPTADDRLRYPFLASEYFVCVARAQVDNNIHLVLEAFSKLPDRRLVVVSNWKVSEYGRSTREMYAGVPNIVMLDAIYDQRVLNVIRSNAAAYIHSHSRCGTAPSLVEAICLGLPVLSFDVPQNRETLGEAGLFFRSSEELLRVVQGLSEPALALQCSLVASLHDRYQWSTIAASYCAIFDDQCGRRQSRGQ